MKEPKDYAKGEYKVGTHCFSFTDKGRKEVLGGAEGDRRITVRMYYPVTEESTAGTKRSRIFSPSKTATPAESYPRYSSFVRPSKRNCAASRSPTYPTIPHIPIALHTFTAE